MSGRTWKAVNVEKAEEIKRYLLEKGGNEVAVKSDPEVWRIRFSDSTFTYYKRGTIYSTPSASLDPAVSEAWRYIDSFIGSSYVLPTKNFLIGLDETGKGEVIGHTVLTGTIFPKEVFNKIDLIVGPADTKKHHEFGYWDDLFKKLDTFRNSGFDFITERIPPWHVDKYNLNKILDITYQRILSIFLRKVQIPECRIVMDDYGIGSTLKRFLAFLEKQGAEIVVAMNADVTYLEAKVASLISKRTREETIKRINENPEFRIDGLSVGSGNAGDAQTLNWLKKWYGTGKEWPWFVKKSFKTVREIEGRPEEMKLTPPIEEGLLSKEFLDNLSRGHLSIQSLSVICPYCGEISKAITFAIYENKNGKMVSEAKCPTCKKSIAHAGLTLRYYCGYIVPDSSIIRRGLLSKDLEGSRFFEDFTVIMSSIVRKECDAMRSGRHELDKLANFASIGRIKMECEGNVENIPSNLNSFQRDEMITDVAIKYNAIIVTADNPMKAYSVAKKIFTIFI
ncbi:MAG: hypothetical protein QW506_03205 [Thermoproteota archaeon]